MCKNDTLLGKVSFIHTCDWLSLYLYHTNIFYLSVLVLQVGAHILNEFVLKWNDDVSEVEEVESKELDNLLLFIANLYNFRVMDSKLLYDILHKLALGFSGKEVSMFILKP